MNFIFKFRHKMWIQILIFYESLGCTGTLKLYSHSENEVVISSSSYKGIIEDVKSQVAQKHFNQKVAEGLLMFPWKATAVGR